MNQEGTVGFSVFADIVQIKPLRQVKVELDGGALPGSP